jgi:ABC-2 type transport system permease protein
MLLRWQLLRMRRTLPLLLLVQVALGAGVIYGFAFLIPKMTASVALFFTTGAPTLSLLLVGLTIVPQETAQSRLDGRYLYLSALPVPRLAPMLADVTFWLMVQLPGTAITLLLAVVRFHLRLHLELTVVPAVVLVALTAAAVGYALATTLPPPATGAVSSFVSIALLLFSPINFPLSRLPLALQDVHRVLPVAYMADIVRGSLTGRYYADPRLAFGVVAAWCAAGLVISARAAGRRA